MGNRIPLHLQYIVCLLIALTMQNVRHQGCLQLSPAILPARVCRSSGLPGAQDGDCLAWGVREGEYEGEPTGL